MTDITTLATDYKQTLKLDLQRIDLEDEVASLQWEYNRMVKQLEETKVYKDLQEAKNNLFIVKSWIDWITQVIIDWMIENNIQTLALWDREVILKKTPWSLKVQDESLIPDKYFKTKEVKSLDKNLIKKELDNWVVLPWCEIVSTYKLEVK